jgi:MFS transporter, DHA1 family, inner membrane transport protein
MGQPEAGHEVDAPPPFNPSPQRETARPRVDEGQLLTLLVVGMFLVVITVNMMAPLLVDFAADFHTTVGAMGLLAAASSVPWAILAPFMGALSDRYGRRPVFMSGVIILGLCTVASAFAWDYSSLMVIRVLGGIGGASTGPNIMSSAADYFPANRRGRALGLVVAAVSMATVIGVPALAEVSALFGWRWAFAGQGVLLLVLGGVIWSIFPRWKAYTNAGNSMSGLRLALAERSIQMLMISNTLERAAFTTVATYLAAFLMQSYGLKLDQVAPVLSATAGGTLIGSIIGGRMADGVSRPVLLFTCFQLMAAVAGIPLYLTTPGVVPTAILASIFGLVNSLARPSSMWLISQVPESRRGATMGFTATSNQIGLMLGASIGGLLISTGGYQLLGIQISCASLLSALCCYLGARKMPGREELVARAAVESHP